MHAPPAPNWKLGKCRQTYNLKMNKEVGNWDWRFRMQNLLWPGIPRFLEPTFLQKLLGNNLIIFLSSCSKLIRKGTTFLQNLLGNNLFIFHSQFQFMLQIDKEGNTSLTQNPFQYPPLFPSNSQTHQHSVLSSSREFRNFLRDRNLCKALLSC